MTLYDGEGFDCDLVDCDYTLVNSSQRIKHAGRTPCLSIGSENSGSMSLLQAYTLLQKAISFRMFF